MHKSNNSSNVILFTIWNDSLNFKQKLGYSFPSDPLHSLHKDYIGSGYIKLVKIHSNIKWEKFAKTEFLFFWKQKNDCWEAKDMDCTLFMIAEK